MPPEQSLRERCIEAGERADHRGAMAGVAVVDAVLAVVREEVEALRKTGGHGQDYGTTGLVVAHNAALDALLARLDHTKKEDA